MALSTVASLGSCRRPAPGALLLPKVGPPPLRGRARAPHRASPRIWLRRAPPGSGAGGLALRGWMTALRGTAWRPARPVSEPPPRSHLGEAWVPGACWGRARCWPPVCPPTPAVLRPRASANGAPAGAGVQRPLHDPALHFSVFHSEVDLLGQMVILLSFFEKPRYCPHPGAAPLRTLRFLTPGSWVVPVQGGGGRVAVSLSGDQLQTTLRPVRTSHFRGFQDEDTKGTPGGSRCVMYTS